MVTAATLRASLAVAEVRVNGAVMHYHRLGRGSTLIVVGTPSPLLGEIVIQAKERHRVITPLVPLGLTDCASWLRRFMDGIGVTRAALLADADHALAALDVALRDDERIELLVLLSAGHGVELAHGMLVGGPRLIVAPMESNPAAISQSLLMFLRT